MNCCIIDDDEALLKKIMNILSCHNQVNTIDFTFINDPSYIDYSIQYDILILDIEMPHQDGISIAKKYINTYKNTFIVFLSLHHELVFDTFQVQPYNFIRKEYIDEELITTLVSISHRIQDNFLSISYKGITKNIRLNEIMYIESVQHKCIIHLVQSNTFETSLTLKQLYKKLNLDFYKLNRSIIINWNYVTEIKNGYGYINDISFVIRRGQINAINRLFYLHHKEG